MAQEPAPRILVLGVGEASRRDLGVGLVVAEALSHEPLGEHVAVRAARPGLDALLALEGYASAIIICAALMGETPGAVRSFWAHDAEAELITPLPGLGGTSLTDWLELGALAAGVPAIRVVAVEPAEIAPGTSLSPQVGGAVVAAMEETRRQLA